MVCSSHFRPEDLLPSKVQVEGHRQYKKLKPGSVPSLFAWTQQQSPQPVRDDRKRKNEEDVNDILDVQNEAHVQNDATEVPPEIVFDETEQAKANDVVEDVEPDLDNIAIDETIEVEEPAVENTFGIQTSHAETQTQGNVIAEVSKFGVELFKDNPHAIEYYTGFTNLSHFYYFFSCLGPAALDLNYQCQRLTRHNELFLTLMKLRRDKDDEELAILFHLGKKTVSKVFHTWLNFLYYQV